MENIDIAFTFAGGCVHHVRQVGPRLIMTIKSLIDWYRSVIDILCLDIIVRYPYRRCNARWSTNNRGRPPGYQRVQKQSIDGSSACYQSTCPSVPFLRALSCRLWHHTTISPFLLQSSCPQLFQPRQHSLYALPFNTSFMTGSICSKKTTYSGQIFLPGFPSHPMPSTPIMSSIPKPRGAPNHPLNQDPDATFVLGVLGGAPKVLERNAFGLA